MANLLAYRSTTLLHKLPDIVPTFALQIADKSESSSASKTDPSGPNTKPEDVYEFKTGSAGKEGPSRTGSPTGNSEQASDKSGKDPLQSGKEEKKASGQQQQQPQAGDKRGHDNEEDDEAR